MSGRALRPQGPSCRPALPHSSRPVSQSFQGTHWSSRLFAGPCALLRPAWPGRSVAVRPPDAVGQSRGLDARQSPSSRSGCSVTARRAAAHTGLSPPAPPRARFQRRQPGTLGTHHGAARGTKLATGVTSESPSSSRETCFQMSTASLSPAVGPPETAVPATARGRPPPTARQWTAGVRVGGAGCTARRLPLLTCSTEAAPGESSSKVLILSRLTKWKAFTYLTKQQRERSAQDVRPASVSQETAGPVSQLRGTATPQEPPRPAAEVPPPGVPHRSWRHRRFLPWLIIHTAEFSAKPQGGQTDPVVAWPLVPCGIGTCRPRGPLSHPLAEHPAWRGRRGARRGDVASSRSCLPLKRRERQATGRGQAASWCDGRGAGPVRPGSRARAAGERGPSGVLGSVITAWEGRRCLRDLLYPMPQCTTGDRSGHHMITLETRSPGG